MSNKQIQVAQIVFSAKSPRQRIIHITFSDGQKVVFDKGRYTTSDRRTIEKLLHHDLFKNGTIQLVTAPEHVDAWLRNETPDRLTEETLSKVSSLGLMKLADAYSIPASAHGNLPAVMKTMLVGELLNNSALQIMRAYPADPDAESDADKPVVDWLKKGLEAGVIILDGNWYRFIHDPSRGDDGSIGIGTSPQDAQTWIIENLNEFEARLDQPKAAEVTSPEAGTTPAKKRGRPKTKKITDTTS